MIIVASDFPWDQKTVTLAAVCYVALCSGWRHFPFPPPSTEDRYKMGSNEEYMAKWHTL